MHWNNPFVAPNTFGPRFSLNLHRPSNATTAVEQDIAELLDLVHSWNAENEVEEDQRSAAQQHSLQQTLAAYADKARWGWDKPWKNLQFYAVSVLAVGAGWMVAPVVGFCASAMVGARETMMLCAWSVSNAARASLLPSAEDTHELLTVLNQLAQMEGTRTVAQAVAKLVNTHAFNRGTVAQLTEHCTQLCVHAQQEQQMDDRRLHTRALIEQLERVHRVGAKKLTQ